VSASALIVDAVVDCRSYCSVVDGYSPKEAATRGARLKVFAGYVDSKMRFQRQWPVVWLAISLSVNVGIAMAIGIGIATVANAAPDAAALFKKSCAPCHGADGSGNTPVGKTLKARDLRSAEVAKLSHKEIATIIKNGKGKMPGFGNMSGEDVASLVAFIRELQRKK
jgi:mono/diheme cytochrome c family protein